MSIAVITYPHQRALCLDPFIFVCVHTLCVKLMYDELHIVHIIHGKIPVQSAIIRYPGQQFEIGPHFCYVLSIADSEIIVSLVLTNKSVLKSRPRPQQHYLFSYHSWNGQESARFPGRLGFLPVIIWKCSVSTCRL